MSADDARPTVASAGVAPAAPAEAGDRRAAVVARLRREARAFVELFALTGFAIAQPLYDIFGRAPDQFIFRGATSGDIVRFALVVLVVPALVLWLLEVVVGLLDRPLGRPVRAAAHTVLLGLLVAAFAIPLLRSLVGGWPLVAVGLVVGAAAGLAHRRVAAVRLWSRFAAVAPLGFAGLFLFASQTSELLSDPSAAGGVRIGEPAPVVVIVFDELPLASLVDADGGIDADLFPNFAALADDSHWFRNATTVSNFTWSALPAIVTSQDPTDGRTPTAASHPESLFTLLGDSMDLQVVESVTRLCPTDLCAVSVPRDGGLRGVLADARQVMELRLAPDPGDRDPVAGLVEDQGVEPPPEAEPRTGDPFTQAATRTQEFIDGVQDGGDGLHFLHVLLPHIPYRYLPSGVRYEGPDPDLGRDGDVYEDQPALVELSRQRHLLQLGYTDVLLGEAMAAMEASGLYDDALVVVVADHGIAFEPGRAIRGLDLDNPLDDETAAEVMWVPFFVKEPGQREGTVSDDDVRTTDVVATIADVLDIDVPWSLDGRSALGPPRSGSVKAMFQSDTGAAGVLAGEPYEIDAATGFDLVLGRSVDRFLPPAPDRWWRPGPNGDLVGTPVADAPVDADPLDADLHPDSDPSAVDLGSGRVPALVRATLTGAEPEVPVAVAVNGTIRATTTTYGDGGATLVAAMVSDESFRPGANEVTVHRIDR